MSIYLTVYDSLNNIQVVVMDWICLLVNPNFYRRGKVMLQAEMNKIFGPDMLELRVVFGEEHKDVEEFYAFVRCTNYHDHVSALMGSSAIKSVLSTYDNPVYLSDAEVKEFIESIEYEDVPDNLAVGDVVKVKEGYLSGLTGLVTKARESHTYQVTFRFHTRKFHEEMPISHLTLVESIFSHLKVPVCTDELIDSGILWASVTGIQFSGAYSR
jgi:transcription antitermination factor NusG